MTQRIGLLIHMISVTEVKDATLDRNTCLPQNKKKEFELQLSFSSLSFMYKNLLDEFKGINSWHFLKQFIHELYNRMNACVFRCCGMLYVLCDWIYIILETRMLR